jgi:hypothetical protein
MVVENGTIRSIVFHSDDTTHGEEDAIMIEVDDKNDTNDEDIHCPNECMVEQKNENDMLYIITK